MDHGLFWEVRGEVSILLTCGTLRRAGQLESMGEGVRRAQCVGQFLDRARRVRVAVVEKFDLHGGGGQQLQYGSILCGSASLLTLVTTAL